MRNLLVMELSLVFFLGIAACGQVSEDTDAGSSDCSEIECIDDDGCCPSNCDSLQDSDCKPKCGNGVVEQGETCDGVCPKICGDSDECTRDLIVGDASQCTAECIHEPIVDCVDDDGCCAPSCNALNDNDCLPICGNGLVEDGESCDGDCPVECDDGDMCTKDSISGHAANCDVRCEHAPVEECVDGDGCCAPGCNSLNDDDCEPVCGNGVIEQGETCDPAGDCPSEQSDCNDGDFCTEDVLDGSATECNSVCFHTRIDSCLDGDGCCPAWCNSLNDDDCEPVCGNGLLEEGETCDPPGTCPQSEQDCDDGDTCSVDLVVGSSEQCAAICQHQAISTCSDGDSCCPAACDALSDGDCLPCAAGMHPCEDGCCEFSTESVSDFMGTGQYSDMVIDSNGTIHVVFTDSVRSVVHGVLHDSAYWTFRSVGSESDLGLYPAMDVDDVGKATIAYYQGINRMLMVGREKDDGNFELEAIREIGQIRPNTNPIDVIVNHQGNPIVIFFDESSHSINMAVKGDQWFIWPVVDTNDVVFLKAKQGDDQRIHLVWSELYVDSDKSGLVNYAVFDSGRWTQEHLGYFDSTGSVDIGLDSNGNPHVLFPRLPWEIYHYWLTQSGWESELGISPPNFCDWLSLAIGADDVLHVVVHDHQNDTLLYARKTLSHWAFMVPDTDEEVGIRPTVVMDREMNPVMLHGVESGGIRITYW